MSAGPLVTTCSSCGAPVEWIRNARTGKLAPIDVDPVPDGNVLVDDVYGERVYRVVRAPRGALLRTSHFATCPDANEWRKK